MQCKTLAPEFEKFGNMYAKSKDIVIAQVDADKHSGLGSKFGVQGFPTMKFIPKGSKFSDAVDVNERSAEGLVKFVEGKTKIKASGAKKAMEEPSLVVDLTPDNFDSVALNPKTISMVGFFAPWCGHCKSIKPVWEKLSKLYAMEKHVVIAAVDADAHKELGTRYEVTGFPTLKLFNTGKDAIVPYSGARDLENLVEFINEHAGTDIDTRGKIGPKAGTLGGDESLKASLKEFKEAVVKDDGNKVDLASKFQSEIEGEEISDEKQEKGIYYTRMLQKIMDQGTDYVTKEKTRLMNILESSADSLQDQTRRMFTHRVNVLTEFDEL